MKMLACRTQKALAQKLARLLDIDYVETVTNYFQNQEIKITLTQSLEEQDVFILQSFSKSVNDNIIELLLLIDVAKMAGAKNIVLILPYFAYSRQHTISYNYEPISLSLIIKLLKVAGAKTIYTIDLHSEKITNLPKINLVNIKSDEIFAEVINNIIENKRLELQDILVVSPDKGAKDRASLISRKFNLRLVVIEKIRPNYNECLMMDIKKDVNFKGKLCLIIDDIIDTAGTICQAANMLHEKGAREILAFATHTVLSGDAIEKIEKSPISLVYTTNTFNHDFKLPLKFCIISIENLLLKNLKNIIYASRK